MPARRGCRTLVRRFAGSVPGRHTGERRCRFRIATGDADAWARMRAGPRKRTGEGPCLLVAPTMSLRGADALPHPLSRIPITVLGSRPHSSPRASARHCPSPSGNPSAPSPRSCCRESFAPDSRPRSRWRVSHSTTVRRHSPEGARDSIARCGPQPRSSACRRYPKAALPRAFPVVRRMARASAPQSGASATTGAMADEPPGGCGAAGDVLGSRARAVPSPRCTASRRWATLAPQD